MEDINNPTNNIGFQVQYSAESEQCSTQPLLQPRSSFSDERRAPQHMRKSLSLFHLTEDNQAQSRRIPDAASLSEALHSSDGVLAKVTLPQYNKQLFEALRHRDVREINRLLEAGADPNATCGVDCVSACHLAAMRGDAALSILLESGAEKHRLDRLGRTPLHLAAWAGNFRQVAVLLGLSRDLLNGLDAGDMTTAEDEIRKLSQNDNEFVNVKCDSVTGNSQLPSYWNDNTTDHNCREVEKSLPVLQLGWTALHAASSRAQSRCARLLIAAGADPCARDRVNRTPLDIAGSAYYSNQNIDRQNFTELVTILINANCNNFVGQDRQMPESPLHTAVELGSMEAASLLVTARAPVNWLNRKGQTALHICVKKKLLEHLQILASHGVTDVDIPRAIDVKDKDGQTVLHKAILEGWEPGVSVAIDAGADITSDNKSETPIHLAATTGDVEILNQILNAAKQKTVIDATNSQGETGLIIAVINGHVECVKRLLEDGASITKRLPNNINIFHKAAEKGNLEVLTVLLDHDYTITRTMINDLTTDDKKGYGPIHFAVQNNHTECVKILLARNADRRLKTLEEHRGSTPLHLAARFNHVKIAEVLIGNNKDTVHLTNDIGWTPLHTASRFGSRDMIKLLLKEGADLACLTKKCNTAVDMIMNNLFKPTEFLEGVFDTYISTNDSSLKDVNCKVTVDYSILKPVTHDENMKVIVALLKTGNKYGQRRLLIHPLLESYLHIKWMDTPTLILFLVITMCYYTFLVWFTLYIMVVFVTNDKKHYSPRAYLWSAILFIGTVLIVVQEILYMKVKCRYICQKETWVRIPFVILGLVLLYATTMGLTGEDWPRHVASVVLLLAWLDMTFLQYHFYDYGYYVFMMEKVAANVVKIILAFAFLLLAFSIIFMLQFKFQEPFDEPFNALIKIIAMMFSELDFENLMKQNKSKEFTKSLTILRIAIFVFLIFSSIVTAIASASLYEPHITRTLVRIRILKKRIEFLGSLEIFMQNRFVLKILPKLVVDTILKGKRRIISRYILTPSVPKSNRAVPCKIRESICAIAESQYNKRTTE